MSQVIHNSFPQIVKKFDFQANKMLGFNYKFKRYGRSAGVISIDFLSQKENAV
jgi:hypothetical protein